MKLNKSSNFYWNPPTLATSFGGIFDEKDNFLIKKKSAVNFTCGAIHHFISSLEKENQSSHFFLNLPTLAASFDDIVDGRIFLNSKF